METSILLATAISIGFVHTVIGPDHYLPFIMIARSRGWSLAKTIRLTVFCGLGHVLSSVVLGLVGVAFGLSVGLLENVESVRGDIASWLLIGFGLLYGAWGLRVALRSRTHIHPHEHDERGHHTEHAHLHHHHGQHTHPHGDPKSITPWALFIIFVLGPCEPLIPILMYPASQGSWMTLAWVTLAFSIVTISTMTAIVALTSRGLLNLNLGFMERYSHALAGFIIVLSGLSIKVLGL
ncbi:MAG: hypothetical protein HGB19_00860 [Chlorobiales bacterium]|nr:hypothetical protein [Chlorobiales bacterium]